VDELETELLTEPDFVAVEFAEEDVPIAPSNSTIINDNMKATTDDLNSVIASLFVVSRSIFSPQKYCI
jgi:hypothetical protein